MMVERECSVDDLIPELADKVEQLLPNEEPVLMCYELEQKRGWFFSGVFGIYIAYVITPARLIKVYMVNDRVRLAIARQLHEISSISEEVHDGLEQPYTFVVDRSDEMSFFFQSKDAYTKFLFLVRKALDEAKNRQTAMRFENVLIPQPPHVRLRILSELHKDKLISDAEFEEKRQEILREL